MNHFSPKILVHPPVSKEKYPEDEESLYDLLIESRSNLKQSDHDKRVQRKIESILGLAENEYIIDRILNQRTWINGKEYLVSWLGYREVTWIHESLVPKNLVNDFSKPSDGICEECLNDSNWRYLLICEVCNKMYHTFCLGMKRIPVNDFICSKHMGGKGSVFMQVDHDSRKINTISHQKLTNNTQEDKTIMGDYDDDDSDEMYILNSMNHLIPRFEIIDNERSF